MDGKTAQKIEAVGKVLLLIAAAALMALAWPPLLPDVGADAAARANTHTAQPPAYGTPLERGAGAYSATGRTEKDYTTVWPEGVDLHSLSPESLSTYDRATMARMKVAEAAKAGQEAVVVGALVETADGGKAEVAKEPRYVLTEREKKLMSVTAVNADHTDDESLMAVVQVILNRAFGSGRFPGTVEEVLRQKNQFESCDRVHRYALDAYDYERIAGLIDRVCMGEDVFGGELALYYSHHRVAPHRIARGLVFVARYGETAFYKQD